MVQYKCTIARLQRHSVTFSTSCTVNVCVLSLSLSVNSFPGSDTMHWLMTMVHCIASQYIANVNEKEGLFNTSGSEVGCRCCELQWVSVARACRTIVGHLYHTDFDGQNGGFHWCPWVSVYVWGWIIHCLYSRGSWLSVSASVHIHVYIGTYGAVCVLINFTCEAQNFLSYFCHCCHWVALTYTHCQQSTAHYQYCPNWLYCRSWLIMGGCCFAPYGLSDCSTLCIHLSVMTISVCVCWFRHLIHQCHVL